MQNAVVKNIVNIVAVGLTLLLVIFGIYGWFMGWFKDLDSMRDFVWQAGMWGPIAFLTIQILQVVLPFIPGGVTMVTGVMAFGPLWGFIFNFTGIITGSLINFALAKRYGRPLVMKLMDEDVYNKYIGRIENSKGFVKFFAIAIFLPFFPDDTLCLIAGLTKMSYKTFMLILLLGKPASISVYSLAVLSAGAFLPFM